MNIEIEVQTRLLKALENPEINIDFTDGIHMTLEVKSTSFNNLNLIEQHKLIYQILDDLIKEGDLHALKLKTKKHV